MIKPRLSNHEVLLISRFGLGFLSVIILTALTVSGFFAYISWAATDSVTATVQITVCGNGVVDSGEECDNTDFNGQSCGSLGYSTGSLGCNSACERQVNACVSGVSQVSETETVTASSGGEVTLVNTNGTTVAVELPVNFYSSNVTVQVDSYASDFFSSTKPAPSGKTFVGKTYDISLVQSSGAGSGNQVTTVDEPASITINYLDADFSGLSESSIAPYRWGAGSSAWQRIDDYSLDSANNVISFNTSNFSAFALLATSSTPVTGGGGGGGGGVGVTVAPASTTVIFSGYGYPGHEIFLLKDAQLVSSAVTTSDSRFEMSITGLAAGNYNFSLYCEDKYGVRSTLLTFPVSITAGTTTRASGIFLSPTLSADKEQVKQGDVISFFGQAAAGSEITININSEHTISVKAKANDEGVYIYNFLTTDLEKGEHLAKSRASLNNILTANSRAVSFAVGDKNVQADTAAAVVGDVNGDKKVNLIDFSVAAYWYQRANPPTNADLNKDGVVNIIDFSILAFHWTG